jgi:3-dehydroquinate dehydratase
MTGGGGRSGFGVDGWSLALRCLAAIRRRTGDRAAAVAGGGGGPGFGVDGWSLALHCLAVRPKEDRVIGGNG